MDTLVSSLVPIATVAVAFVLLLGLFNMLRGGNPNTSQRLMRLRVLLQFLAIIVIMGVVWWRAT
jgi:Hypoxia induced protein conserved region